LLGERVDPIMGRNFLWGRRYFNKGRHTNSVILSPGGFFMGIHLNVTPAWSSRYARDATAACCHRVWSSSSRHHQLRRRGLAAAPRRKQKVEYRRATASLQVLRSWSAATVIVGKT